MEKSCLKIPFSFLQFTKKAEKAIFGAKYIFRKICNLCAGKLLSFRKLYLAYSKHAGTLCTNSFSTFDNFNFWHWSGFRIDSPSGPMAWTSCRILETIAKYWGKSVVKILVIRLVFKSSNWLSSTKKKKKKLQNFRFAKNVRLRLLSSTIYFRGQLIFALTLTSTTWSNKLT